MGSTRPMWVGLGSTYVMGWVGFGLNFFDPPWWVGSKNPLNTTQPDPCTPLSTASQTTSTFHRVICIQLQPSFKQLLPTNPS